MKKYFGLLPILASCLVMACNNSGDAKKTTADSTTGNGDSTMTDNPAPFSKEVSYDDHNGHTYKFTVMTNGGGDQHHFRIISQGLSESNDTLFEDVKGAIKDVIIDDIDGDNSPEIGIIDMNDATQQGHLHVFSAFNGKSMGAVHLQDLPEGDKNLAGYKGGDEFQFVENSLVRRFPIYEGETKTGKTRQLQYKLKEGEAMKQLVLDKAVEF